MAECTPEERQRQLIIVTSDNFVESTEYIYKSIARYYGGNASDSSVTVNDEVITLASIRTKLHSYLKDYSSIDLDAQPRLDFGNCKCTHPPSNGLCLFGGCIFGSIGRGGGSLSFTINI